MTFSTQTHPHSMKALVAANRRAGRLDMPQDEPEPRILLGTASALGDVVQYPSMLDTNRAAILSGLDACERMLPHLHTWALYAGAVELDRLLSGRDFTSGDVRVALGVGQ